MRGSAAVADAGWIEVRHDAERSRVRLTISDSLRADLVPLLAAVRRQFDLDCDPHRVGETLGSLAASSGRDCDCRALSMASSRRCEPFLGQQVSVAAATTLAGRLVLRDGTPVATPFTALTHRFPTASELSLRGESDLTELGILATRARSILALARVVASGELRLDADAPLARTQAQLLELPGIGEWTAQYIALRCLSWPDAFPHTDLIIRRAFPGLTPQQILTAAE